MTTLARYTKKFLHYLRHNRAVSAMEYAILVGVIATGIGLAVAGFMEDIDALIDSIGDKVSTANPTGTVVTPTAPTQDN